MPQNQALWHQGSTGATQFTRGEAQRFARQLLQSQIYRDKLEERIAKGTLSPQVETMLWHYAFGKPVEQIEVTVPKDTEDLSALPLAELYSRAQKYADELAEALAIEQALPADVVKGPW